MAVLRLSALTKRFADVRAVDDISLVVPDGALVTLLGPSGCGKTTMLRLIAGFVTPDAGEIRLGERQISAPGWALAPEHRNMAMIFQSYALWPHMTVAENIGYGLRQRRLLRAESEARVARILDIVRLGAIADRYPAELSGGQQQRVALARALVVEPQTLLLDEPLSNLDAGLREEMRFEIRRLHDAFRTTSLYVTHDQTEAMTTADLIVVMNQGRIEQAGPPEEVYRRPESEFVARFLGGTNILRGRNLGDGLVEVDGVRLQVGNAQPGREDVAISIRPHEIVLLPSGAANGVNVIFARIVRSIFAGPSRDVLAAVEGSAETQLRLSLPTDSAPGVGERVALRLPPERCRLLAQ